MNIKSYHHQNLRNMLIETGIKIVNQEGYQNLSMRKLAALCDVSHAAPYRHFKNKEELLGAMQEYVEQIFSQILENSLLENQDASYPMVEFGKSYVLFFLEHPEYYAFFTHQQGIEIIITENQIPPSNYRPFNIFLTVASKHLIENNVPINRHSAAIAGMWATVHGLAGMATMPGVSYAGDWGKLTEQILKGASPHE